MKKYIVVLCTIDSFEKAREISGILLNEKLIACSNIIPKVTSIYHWNGEVCEDNECLVIMKSKRNVFNLLKDRIKMLHPYDIPEILALDVCDGAKEYLNWLDNSLL